ncbi:MAG: ABC transporter C-terminal domain-containing protein [Thermodesulfobacteriota bacterium]|nr:ABC transporter C-terminal domain-containing protein [Thermodesulfobacteriota bacterium]
MPSLNQSTKRADPALCPPPPRRLTFKEQRELEELPGIIENLEAQKQQLFTAMADPVILT